MAPIYRVATVLLLGTACSSTPRGATSGPEVVFRIASRADVHVKVELARDNAERQRGLMYRRSLESGAGMLFLFPDASTHQFWMHNTYIPLDMIFLAADRTVVFVEENAEPLTDRSRGPTEPTQYVVEVPGGWAKTHGIEPGTSARFDGVPETSSTKEPSP